MNHQQRNKDVDAYLALAPEEQRALLERLRRMIREALPHARECFESKMPAYTVNGAWTAGFATRAKGAMFYVMDTRLLDEYAGVLGRHRSGRSCVEMRASRQMSLAQLESIAAEILGKLAARRA